MYCRSHLLPSLVISFTVLCCLNVLSLPVRADSHQDTFTQEELQEVYRALPEEDKKVVDSWTAAEREEYLRTKARTRREYSSEQSGQVTRDYSAVEEVPAPYVVDPLLKEAMTKYKDMKVPREEVLGLFNKYLDKTPDSVFRPEVYFRIAALYSMHRRVELGEEYDHQKMVEYFQKAHELYGTKYSSLHRTTWASLANMPEKDLEFRKGYLRWLQGISEMDVNDVWPVRQIEQTFNGRSPELSAAEKEARVRNFRKYEELNFDTASKNIFYIEAKNYRSLVDLAKSFPGTELAKQCSRLASRRDQFYLDAVEWNGFQTDALQNEIEQRGEPTADVSSSGGLADPGPADAESDPNGDSTSGPAGKSASILLSKRPAGGSRSSVLVWCGVVIALVAVFLLTRKRKCSAPH